jgi:hypothetical protein
MAFKRVSPVILQATPNIYSCRIRRDDGVEVEITFTPDLTIDALKSLIRDKFKEVDLSKKSRKEIERELDNLLSLIWSDKNG